MNEKSIEDSPSKLAPKVTKKLNCVPTLNQFLSRSFFRLGLLIGRHPILFVLVPIIATAIGGSGLHRLNETNDLEYLFYAQNSNSLRDRRTIEAFIVNVSSQNVETESNSDIPAYLPDGRQVTNYAQLIIKPRDNGNLFRVDVLNEILTLDNEIKNLEIVEGGIPQTYQFNSFNLPKVSDVIFKENGTFHIRLSSPKLLLILGQAKFNREGTVVESAKALMLTYFLYPQNTQDERNLSLVSDSIKNYLSRSEMEFLQVTSITSGSYSDELTETGLVILRLLVAQILVVVAFTVLSVASRDCVRSKVYLGLIGIISAGLATLFAFGVLMYCGVESSSINYVVPYIMMGIGLDDMFVLLSAWRRTSPGDPTPQRLASAYGDVGISITVTSLTDIVSFIIGFFTPFPGVQIFCLYAGGSILATYVWFLSFFGGSLALIGSLELKQKHAILLCKTVKSNSESEKKSFFYRLFCSGGVNKKDILNPKDNRPHPMSIFFRDYFGAALTKPAFKGIVIFALFLYVGGAIFGCTKLKEWQNKKQARPESQLGKFDVQMEEFFREYIYMIKGVITDRLNYSDPETKKKVLEFHDEFDSLDNTASMFTTSFIREVYTYIEGHPNLQNNINSESDFVAVVKKEFLPRHPELARYALFDNNTISATMFTFRSYNLKDPSEDFKYFETLKEISDRSPVAVVMSCFEFMKLEMIYTVRTTTLKTLIGAALAMICISLLLIPHKACSICIGLSILSVELGVVGYMSLWNVHLDSVTMINLIMCLGFSVDFSAHISYAYVTSNGRTPDERMKDSLYCLGLPVLQGGGSTACGVILLATTSYHVFLVFFKVIMLVIIFGIFHALFILPVVLSLVDSGLNLLTARSK